MKKLCSAVISAPLSAGVTAKVTIRSRRAYFALAALVLTSCAGKPTIAKIPIATSCVKGDIPSEPERVKDKLTGDSGRDIGIIAGSNIQLRAWGRSLAKMLEACRGQ